MCGLGRPEIISPEYIKELRQLVDVGLAHEPAHPGDPVIVPAYLFGIRFVVHFEAPEFDAPERLVIFADLGWIKISGPRDSSLIRIAISGMSQERIKTITKKLKTISKVLFLIRFPVSSRGSLLSERTGMSFRKSTNIFRFTNIMVVRNKFKINKLFLRFFGKFIEVGIMFRNQRGIYFRYIVFLYKTHAILQVTDNRKVF